MDRISRKIILIVFFTFLAVPASQASSKPVDIYANLVTGFDNNVFLSSERKGDWFMQENLILDYKTPLLQDHFRLRASYDVLNNNYFEYTLFSYLDQNLGLGLDYRVMDGTWLQLDYSLIYTDFYDDNEELTNLTQKVRFGLLKTLADNMSLRVSYRATHRDFDERKLRQPSGLLSLTDERTDDRPEIETELSVRLARKTVMRAGFTYFLNDSNDQFHDYYDYRAYKLYLSAAMPVFDSWTMLGRFSYQNEDYESRPLLDSPQTFQNDDIYQVSIGLSKKLRENISLTGIYSYRQKASNEPSQSYSGSIVTLGLYTSF